MLPPRRAAYRLPALADFPPEAMNRRTPNVAHTPWELLEHIRIAQWDILAFIRDPAHVSSDWPAGYWPGEGERADQRAWAETVRGFRADREALVGLVADPATDLTAPLDHAPEYTVLREILVAADHAAGHLGEFELMREGWGPGGTREAGLLRVYGTRMGADEHRSMAWMGERKKRPR